jgi:hypothetical protein
MGTVTHNFHAGDTVSVITVATASCPSGILSGVVIQVRITEQTSGFNTKYDVRLGDDAGTTVILESNMFATLEQAIAEYYSRKGGDTLPAVSPLTLTLDLT